MSRGARRRRENSLTGTGTAGDPFILTWNLGDLNVGTTGTVTIPVTVNTGTVGQTLFNVASVANDRQESTLINNVDSDETFVGSLPNVFIGKDGPAIVQPGEMHTYTLTYGNNGNAPAPNVVVTDTFPPGVRFVSSVPVQTTLMGTPFVNETATWNFGTLNTGTMATITVTFEVGTNVALIGSNLVNLAQISTTTNEIKLADNADDHLSEVLLLDLARISGFVWLDEDQDVTFDPAETGIPGVTVLLTGTDIFGNAVWAR